MASCGASKYAQIQYFDKFYESESNASLHTAKYNRNALI